MREGVELFDSEDSANSIGKITSGGFGPTVERPIAMAMIDKSHASVGNVIFGELRGKRLPLTITKMPFRPAQFKR